MSKQLSVLFVGESWMIQTTETKGVDSFTTYRYEECANYVGDRLREGGIAFTHIPCHRVEFDFPQTLEELQKYDVVMLSDVGANTMLISTKTFFASERTVNKLHLIRDYVRAGGGFCRIGGSLTYLGLEAKGCYKRTAIEEILPVELMSCDDRVECPEGFCPETVAPEHPVMDGIDEPMPWMLGYNRTVLKPGATLIARREDDPIIAAWDCGAGRTMAYTCDCAPHWASPELCNWKHYSRLWQNIVHWLARA